MPLLLYRYMLGQFLRVWFLTTLVVVVVVAFGATVKPLTEDNLLTATQALKYMGLAMVLMVRFVLPFAAGFAATLVLHRMTSDNEIMAAAASGLSYRRLLAPMASIAGALTLVMIVLTQWLVPMFWSVMEGELTRDVTRVMQAKINRDEAFKSDNMLIWAEELYVEEQPSDTTADRRLILTHATFARLDEDGRVDSDCCAEYAVMDVYLLPDRTFLKVRMENPTWQQDAGSTKGLNEFVEKGFEVPSKLRDEVEFRTQSELLALRENPDDYARVRRKRDNLAQAMRQTELWRELARRVQGAGTLTFTTAGGRQFQFTAGEVMGQSSSKLRCRDAVLTIWQDGRMIRSATAPRAEIMVTEAPSATFDGATRSPSEEIRLTILLRAREEGAGEGVRVTDLSRADRPTTARADLERPNLLLDDPPGADMLALPSRALLQRVEAMEDPPNKLVKESASLLEQIQELEFEIRSQLHKRYALSATALLLPLLGAVLAMLLRNSLPLTVYLMAFVPSVADLLLISGGDQMMREGQVLAGMAVMWSGNVLLVVVLVVAYLRLARN